MNKRIVALFVLLVVLIAAFAGCGASASSVNGVWYESTGILGTLEFKDGGAATMVMMGQPIECTYTFDAAKGEGTITYEGDTAQFAIKDGKLNLDGAIYTRDKVEQQSIDNLMEGLGDALGN